MLRKQLRQPLLQDSRKQSYSFGTDQIKHTRGGGELRKLTMKIHSPNLFTAVRGTILQKAKFELKQKKGRNQESFLHLIEERENCCIIKLKDVIMFLAIVALVV